MEEKYTKNAEEGLNLPDKVVLTDDSSKQRNDSGRAVNKKGPRMMKFIGRCNDLISSMCNFSNASQAADMFTKTTQEVAEYVGCTYKYGADTRLAIENMTVATLTKPSDPEMGASRTASRILEKEVDKVITVASIA